MNSYVTGKGVAAVHKVLSKKNHWCQKKSIDIFNFKQRLLSLDMKTKVVQHFPRINLSHFNFWILNLKFKIFIFFWFPAFVWLSDIFIFFSPPGENDHGHQPAGHPGPCPAETRQTGQEDWDSPSQRTGAEKQNLKLLSKNIQNKNIAPQARLEILKIHAGPITKHGDIDYEAVVKLSDGFNGADLRNVCTEAGLFAIR